MKKKEKNVYKSTATNKQTHEWMDENTIYLYRCLRLCFIFFSFLLNTLCVRALFKRATPNEYFVAVAELRFYRWILML